MEEKEIKKIIEEHLLSKVEEFINAYKENPPKVETKLQYQPGEPIIAYLPKEDLIQLASRYLNDNAVYLKNILHFLVRIERLLTWELEEQGVDIQAKFKEDAKKQAELVEQRIVESKKALKESVKN